MTTTDQRRLVLDFAESQASDPQAVGVKAANLARLVARSFRVPEGFVVTAAACDQIHSGIGIPTELWCEIRSHLDKLGECPLAVRSSGLAEDLPDASYAGQYESVLGVVGDDAVAEAIARCITSASSARVRTYLGAGVPARMAVIVQKMVPADAAGVAFTANPVTGDREVLVSAVKGLGDRRVGGEATPDEVRPRTSSGRSPRAASSCCRRVRSPRFRLPPASSRRRRGSGRKTRRTGRRRSPRSVRPCTCPRSRTRSHRWPSSG
jgi:phosphoenolpyruvate synthase/pyruvate phosphate dikinase